MTSEATGATPSRPVRPKIEITTAPVAGGVAVLVNGRPAKTPRGHELVVPGNALARAIAVELSEEPRLLTGRGLNDPAAAPNYRIALGGLDIIAGDAEARDKTVDEIAAYAGTDLVCYRAERPDELVRRQAQAWSPLLAWLAGTHGATLCETTAILPAEHEPAALDAVRDAIAALDPMRLAALSLATRASGSVVIGLALIGGGVDAEGAYDAAVLDEAFQAEQWGEDEEALKRRAGVRLDLEKAARFVELLDDTGKE